MLFKAGGIPNEQGVQENNKLSSQYYEEVGDPLAQFRKIYPGGIISKADQKDGWHKDPDWEQYQRDVKLYNDAQSKGLRT